MKNRLLFVLVLVAFSVFSNSKIQATEKSNPVFGEWIYAAVDAPSPYEKGSLIFSEKDGKTECKIKLDAGELLVSNLKIAKNTITFSTIVEGNTITVELIRNENKLTGKADTPEGLKAITATKK